MFPPLGLVLHPFLVIPSGTLKSGNVTVHPEPNLLSVQVSVVSLRVP